MTAAPRTEAGKRLLEWLYLNGGAFRTDDRDHIESAISAIEAEGLRDALNRVLTDPWTGIETTAARALFDKAKASRTQEVTITAQQLRTLLPAIESEAVVGVIRRLLATPAEPPRADDDDAIHEAGTGYHAPGPDGYGRPPFRFGDPATLDHGPEKSAAIHERLEAKYCWMRDCDVPTHGHDPRYETSGSEAYHLAEAEASMGAKP